MQYLRAIANQVSVPGGGVFAVNADIKFVRGSVNFELKRCLEKGMAATSCQKKSRKITVNLCQKCSVQVTKNKKLWFLHVLFELSY